MASNITKNFDQRKKFGLRMATGGIVDQMNNLANLSNTERYKLGMSGTAAEASTLQERAGILSGLQTAAPAAPAPAAPAATQPVAKPYDHMATVQSRGETISALGSKLRSMQQAAPKMASSTLDAGSSMAPMPKVGLRAGGVVDPEQNEVYEIEGPGDGSGVDDNVDVNVHGKNIKVSKGEKFVVLPASVPKENIEEFIESQTGEPSATAKRGGLREGLRAFGGAVTDAGDLLEKLPKGNPVPVVDDFGNVVKPSAKSVTMGQQAARAAAPIPSVSATPAPTPAATAPVQSAGRTLAARAALGPAVAVGTGVGLGMEAAKFVDSFPSLRGKATAASTNMTLAGTPQHDSEVNSELAAKDVTWQARHGKTLPGEAAIPQASYGNEARRATNSAMSFGNDPSRDALNERGALLKPSLLSDAQRDVVGRVTGSDVDPEGVTAGGTWVSKNDVAGDFNTGLRGADINDPNRLADGQGVISMRQKDGTYKNAVIAPSRYIGADGKETSRWEDTQAYKDAIGRNEKDKATLRDLQYQNAMNSINSHNPGYQQEGLRTAAAMLARDNVEADKSAKAASLNLQTAQLRHQLNKDAQAQANADRTYEAGRDDKHEARVNEVLDSFAGDKKADGYAQRRALMERFKNNFDQVYKGDRKGYLKALQTELGLELALEEHGRKWNIFGEKPWDGGISAITPEKAPWYRLGDQVYKDSHGRQASAYDLRSSLTPDMVAALEARIASSR